MPIITMMPLATKIGPGQRTTEVPTLRHSVDWRVCLVSSSLNFAATVTTAGPRVSATTTTTSIPIETG